MSTTPSRDRTEVVHGFEKTTSIMLRFMSKTQGRVCFCSDSSGSFVKSYLEGLGTMKANGVSSNYITEITKDNISYSKQLVDLTSELRHLDGFKGNFAVSQSEYLAVNHLQKSGSEPELIYTDVKEMVEAQQFVFDNLWNLGISAEQKIKQIEEGIEPEFLEVSGRNNAATVVTRLVQSVQKEALILLPNDKALMRADKAGVLDPLIAASTRGASVRIICPITDRNSGIVKRITENAPLLQVHNAGALPYGFIIIDNEKYFSAAGGMEDREAENLSEAIGFGLYSNNRASIDSFRSFFELIWNKPVTEQSLTDAELRIYLDQVMREISRARIGIIRP